MGRTLCMEHEWLDEGPCPFCEDNMLAPSCIERSELPYTSRKYMDFLEVELRKNDQRIAALKRSLYQAAAEYVWDALKLDEDSPDYEQTEQRVLQRWLDIHKIPGEE